MTPDKLDEVIEEFERRLGPVRAPISAQFHRTFADGPFDICDFCGKPLGETGSRYMIVKYYSAGELRQELALCSETLDGLRRCYSEHSLKSMQRWYSPELMASRRILVGSIQDEIPRRLTEHCLFCSRSKSEVSEFFEYALCEGNELLCAVYPSTQCGECMRKVVNSLSAETLDMRRKFFQKQFGPPPDIYLGVWTEAELAALQ
jgi:hypothetical protein